MSLSYLFLFFVVSGMIRIGGVLLCVLWYELSRRARLSN